MLITLTTRTTMLEFLQYLVGYKYIYICAFICPLTAIHEPSDNYYQLSGLHGTLRQKWQTLFFVRGPQIITSYGSFETVGSGILIKEHLS